MSLSGRWKYSRLRPKNTATYTRYRNWLSTRYHARGNGVRPLPDRVGNAVSSRTPVYRNRISPATGRPRRDAIRTGPKREPVAERLYMRRQARHIGPGEALARATRSRTRGTR